MGWNHRVEDTFIADAPQGADVFERYRRAFATLRRAPEELGVLGGLGIADHDSRAIEKDGVSICQRSAPPILGGCSEQSSLWKDHIEAVGGCFAGEDQASVQLLLELGGTPFRCELANVDYLPEDEAVREMCLCNALSGPATSVSGRHVLRVRYQARDLVGKARPEVRVVEATTNLHAEEDWHRIPAAGGAAGSETVNRLIVDNVDAVAAPLARCAMPLGAIVVGELDVTQSGAVAGARLVAGAATKTQSLCVEHALMRGRFDCTDDGKPAVVRVVLHWR